MDRRERLGLNEAVFREVNERITDLAESFGLEEQQLDLVCECADPDCRNTVLLSSDDYDAIRPELVLYPGHPGPAGRSLDD